MINAKRYDEMIYNRCGKSGLKLPAISLGIWHNFGSVNNHANSREMILTAFNLGITHIDAANNYGPIPGSAESTLGRVLKEDLYGYRDELIISTKAGYGMWPGPYGDFGSKKYLIASLNQSLIRLGLDYVDIFYSHRPDPETPIEETMEALYQAVHSGKALYAGISSYNPEQSRRAIDELARVGVRCLIHQPSYSMLNRWIENGLQDVLEEKGVGSIAFCPLASGLLTSRYANGIPEDSRASHGNLNKENIQRQSERIQKLTAIAGERGQSLAQMALAWVLRGGKVTSALIGASRKEQIIENVGALQNLAFTPEELAAIDEVLA